MPNHSLHKNKFQSGNLSLEKNEKFRPILYSLRLAVFHPKGHFLFYRTLKAGNPGFIGRVIFGVS